VGFARAQGGRWLIIDTLLCLSFTRLLLWQKYSCHVWVLLFLNVVREATFLWETEQLAASMGMGPCSSLEYCGVMLKYTYTYMMSYEVIGKNKNPCV
jgi:hypothetical protein